MKLNGMVKMALLAGAVAFTLGTASAQAGESAHNPCAPKNPCAAKKDAKKHDAKAHTAKTHDAAKAKKEKEDTKAPAAPATH
ncbi:MAG: hypothetical protein HQL63_00060 [Magnetococcales bacterium]|nr:hypothetical protein [Magnetococcales bacterium]MBF0323256.1 hypothetical protein [Magnetococcales bacterium]